MSPRIPWNSPESTPIVAAAKTEPTPECTNSTVDDEVPDRVLARLSRVRKALTRTHEHGLKEKEGGKS